MVKSDCGHKIHSSQLCINVSSFPITMFHKSREPFHLVGHVSEIWNNLRSANCAALSHIIGSLDL